MTENDTNKQKYRWSRVKRNAKTRKSRDPKRQVQTLRDKDGGCHAPDSGLVTDTAGRCHRDKRREPRVLAHVLVPRARWGWLA